MAKRIERIPSAAFRRIGKLGRWATDGACLLREDCPFPLEASRGMHPSGYFEVGWTWKRGVRASVSEAARILASVQRAAPGPSLLFAPRFARVLRAGVTFPVVLAPAKAGEYCTIAAGVWRDGELIALVMPCVPPWSGDRSPQRIDINGRPVRWEVT